MSDRYMALEEMKQIPDDQYPFMVFADNIRGLFSLGVKLRTKGSYGHFMWLISQNLCASQWFWFREFRLDHFAGCTMKLVHNPNWKVDEKELLIAAIRKDLKLPWHKTLYDVLAIIGQLIGWNDLQLKGNRICSECVSYLGLVDYEANIWFKEEHTPTPAEVNAWTKARGDRYQVYGRYSPD